MKSKKITKLKEITEEYKKRGIENPERAAAMYLKGFITAKKLSVKNSPEYLKKYANFFNPDYEDYYYKDVPPVVGGE